MQKLYTTVGIFKLKTYSKNNIYPVVILSGKECRLDIQEMMLWSALNWKISDKTRLENIYKLNEEKSKFVASRSFDETLERLIVRGLVAEGCGKTDREALYNLISGLYIIPLHQSLFIRTVSFIRMIMLYNIPYEKAKVLFCKDKKTKSEKKIMELAFSAPMLTAEIVECIDRKIDFIFSEDDVLDFLYADSSVKSTNIADKAHILPSVNSVIADISNLYLRKQILFERL